mgnify:CR=1 FL=1
MVFKSDSSTAGDTDEEHGTLVLATAAAVLPVGELNAINRAALCRTASVVHVQRNDRIKPENSHRWLMYLVDGALTLHTGREEVGQLHARTPEALQPLFLDKGAYQHVRTNTMAKIVRFGREQLDILLREQQKNAIHVIEIEVGELENTVFDGIVADVGAHRVRLASARGSVARITGAAVRVASIPDMAEVIQSDPGLTAHIVNAANRIETGSTDPITSVRGAISRLGVETTQRSIEELLEKNTLVPSSEVLDRRFQRYLKRSALATAIVQVLARELPYLKPDIAALTAQTADIGELLALTYANEHGGLFADDASLASTIEKLRTVLGVWLLNTWSFPREFVEASLTARNWYRNHSGEITYTDLVTAALLIIQAEMPDAAHSSVPSADNLLLARRLQQAGIDLKSPGEIIRAATGRLVTVQTLLKAA